MSDLDRAKELLLSGGYTCVLISGSNELTSTERGVKPLMDWMEVKTDLSGFSAADKVIGRATACLYVHLGIIRVYAQVISEGARAVFEQYGVEYFYSKSTPGIINRRGDGPCPMEAAVRNISDVDEAVPTIINKYRAMNG